MLKCKKYEILFLFYDIIQIIQMSCLNPKGDYGNFSKIVWIALKIWFLFKTKYTLEHFKMFRYSLQLPSRMLDIDKCDIIYVITSENNKLSFSLGPSQIIL